MTTLSRVSISKGTITVCIMSYKYGHLAAQAVESVIAQTKKPDKIKLYDDGVGDCEHLRKLYPEVQVVKRHRNLGVVDNFNEALKKVDTGRVLFLGADNWLHPEALELMSREEADIVSCDAYMVGEGKYRRWTLHYQPHGSALYDVGKALLAGGYQHSGRVNAEEDSVLFGKMMTEGASFHRVDKPLLYYRRHRANFIRH